MIFQVKIAGFTAGNIFESYENCWKIGIPAPSSQPILPSHWLWVKSLGTQQATKQSLDLILWSPKFFISFPIRFLHQILE
jgi:hypothetical protein